LSGRREFPRQPMLGVAGVIIDRNRALLVRRGHPPLQGEWSIPGGLLEVGETILDGVRRELREETNLDVRVLNLIEIFERIEAGPAGAPRYHFVVLDYLCEKIGGEPKAGGDAAEVAWVEERDLAKYSLTQAAAQVVQSAFRMSRAEISVPEKRSP
jgi:8-oxo-dGTP diphosphatase